MHNDMISESIDPQNGIIQVFEFQLKVFNELKVKALKWNWTCLIAPNLEKSLKIHSFE